MSRWSYYLTPRHECLACRTEIRHHDRIFLCERGELCEVCGKAEEELLRKHVCDWCGKPAEDRAALAGTGGSVWWCKRHAKVGRESAAGFESASKGSLYGEMRRGKLGDAEEARA